MARQEILKDINLDENRLLCLEMHSVMNMINVIMCELMYLRRLLRKEDCLVAAVAACHDMRLSFSTVEDVVRNVESLTVHRNTILNDLYALVNTCSMSMTQWELFNECVKALKNILEVLSIRLDEMVDRSLTVGAWRSYLIRQLHEDMMQFLYAIADNSHRRYGIVFSQEKKRDNDYYVAFDFQSVQGDRVKIPSVLNDSLRDITANARKYSLPGSRIFVSLDESENAVNLTVEDEGRGIPSDEISRVVEYGYRASNTTVTETQGGGYGLTKAYLMTRRFGGRMWIDSEPEKGTKIELVIPKPCDEV